MFASEGAVLKIGDSVLKEGVPSCALGAYTTWDDGVDGDLSWKAGKETGVADLLQC